MKIFCPLYLLTLSRKIILIIVMDCVTHQSPVTPFISYHHIIIPSTVLTVYFNIPTYVENAFRAPVFGCTTWSGHWEKKNMTVPFLQFIIQLSKRIHAQLCQSTPPPNAPPSVQRHFFFEKQITTFVGIGLGKSHFFCICWRTLSVKKENASYRCCDQDPHHFVCQLITCS